MKHLNILEQISNSPKTAAVVPVVTAAIAPLSEIAKVQGIVSITSMILGMGLTFFLIQHWRIKVQIAKLELERLKKEAEGLTCK